jgi:hypothetical protein
MAQALPKMGHLPMLDVQTHANQDYKRVSSQVPNVWWRNGIVRLASAFLEVNHQTRANQNNNYHYPYPYPVLYA